MPDRDKQPRIDKTEGNRLQAEEPSININYPPSTAYEVVPDDKYWEAVAANAALIGGLNAVNQGQKREDQIVADVQKLAAEGAAKSLDNRDREAKRIEGIERARAARRNARKAEDNADPQPTDDTPEV